MLRSILLATCVSIAGFAAHADEAAGPVTFNASDGATVHADYQPGEEGAPIIVMFHQARSNGGAEYAAIAPKLSAKGYSLLVVDQRSGGGKFGEENLTVKMHGKSTKFCDAYPDTEGALAFAQEAAPGVPVFIWGSSYSAALTMKLAAEHGDEIAGAVVFSPASGRSTKTCRANDYASKVSVPVKAFLPKSEMGSKGKKQRDLFLAAGHEHHVMEGGVHGASMLDPSRAKGDPAATWEAVFQFVEANTAAESQS